MKTTPKNLSIILILILLSIGTIYFITKRYSNDKKELEAKNKAYKLRNDVLVKEKEGVYSKLLADSLTKKELSDKIKELGIDLENAQLAQKIVFVPRDTIKIIEQIESKGTSIIFHDYYPKRENYFVKHITNLDTKDTTATGEFNFNPITMSLGIGQQKDGTYKVVTKLPPYFDIQSIDVQSLPIEETEKDDWGILVGVDYVNDMESEEKHLDINSYIRFKKVYIGGGFRSDNTVKYGLKFEF